MYYLGIDLGGTNIAVGVCNGNYEIVKKGSVPTLAQRDGEEIVRDMAELCKKLVAEAGLELSQIAYAGIAAPGSVNPAEGVVEYANNLPFRHFEIAKILKKYLPVAKVFLENDANAAAYGEYIGGSAKGTDSSVMITLGTGVGGGIVLDGRVYSGFNYAGAELGHIVIHKGGRQCSCGRKGCFEAYSSASALIAMTKEKMAECPDSVLNQMAKEGKINGKTAFAAMRRGDKAAAEVVDTYIEYLACGLGNIINIFQPRVLTIGGGVCNEGDGLMLPLLEKLNAETYNKDADEGQKTKIRIATLGNDAGIIGASALGRYMH